MEKHKIDKKRDMPYKWGVTLDADTIPDYTKEADNNKKEELKVAYTFRLLCKGSQVDTFKKMSIQWIQKWRNFNAAVNNYLAKTRAERYGEYYTYSSRPTHSVDSSFQTCIELWFSEGFSGSTFTFYEHHVWWLYCRDPVYLTVADEPQTTGWQINKRRSD